MTAQMGNLENLIDGQQKYLDSIGDAIFEASIEGMKIGAYRGAMRGAIDGLKNECLPQGFANIEETKIGDIVSHISEFGISLDAIVDINPVIECMIETYLDRIQLGMVHGFRGQGLELDVVLQLVTQRQKEIGQRLEEKAPRNPLASGIVAGVRTSLDRALESCLQRFRSELSEQTGRDAETRQEQQQLPVREKATWYTMDDFKASIKDAVAKVTEDFVFGITRGISGKTISRITKELKEEAVQKLEKVIRKMAKQKLENGLDESARLVSEEIVKDSRDMMRFIENINSSFESVSKPYLSSLAKGLRVSGKAMATIATCVLAVGTAVVLAGVYHSHTLNISIDPPEAGLVEPSRGDFRSGTVVTIQAMSAEGWRFDSWSGDVSGSDRTINVHMDGDMDITAYFTPLPEVAAIYTLNVSIDPPEAGLVEPSRGNFRWGAVVTIQAMPAEGWRFDSWSGDVSGSDRTTNVHMDGDMDIAAYFTPLPEVAAIYTWWANPITEVFDDIRVRQALCLTIDEGNIVRRVFPEMNIEFSPKEELQWIYDGREWSCLDTDIDLARKLLAEAGYPDGFKLTAAAPSSDESLIALVETVAVHLWEATQIKIDVDYYPSVEAIPEQE
ncbi:ABC transporter substrate-binding protein, partial [Chloroflexota bacterium]